MNKQGKQINLMSILTMLIVLLSGLPSSCYSSTRQVKIYLSDLQPLPATAVRMERPLGIAVAVVFSPENTINKYQKIADYLSEKTGKAFTLMIAPTNEEVNDLIRTGAASVGFVSSGAYAAGQHEFGMQLLAAPEINGLTTGYSYIIVPGGSPSQSLHDLKDTIFACTFPLADTGRLAPFYALLQQGEDLEAFFHRYSYTYSSEKSIKAIAEFLYDGAAVDSRTYDELSVKEPQTIKRIRIIEKLGPYANAPVVVPPFLDGELKEQIKEILLSAENDQAGKDALKAIDIDRFVMIQDNAYDSVREMAKKVWWTR